MSGGCFIGLNACIVRINFTIPFRSQHKCGNNSIEHIGTCMVTDYFLSFRFQCRTEHIVGSCLSICTAGCKIAFRTCEESCSRMSGQILIATFPAQVTPCLPIFLHTYPTNFAAQTAIITLIFIVYDNFLYKYNLCYCRLFVSTHSR